MDARQLQALIKKYNAGKCTPAEKARLEQWYISFEWGKAVPGIPEEELNALRESAWKNIAAQQSGQTGRVRLLRWRYAAILLPAIGIAAAFLFRQGGAGGHKERMLPAASAPALHKVQLQMADGTIVPLDKGENTPFRENDGTEIHRHDSGLVYRSGGHGETALYHTLSTANGARYAVQLADGSKVWLNAASSLHYPARFTGAERTVQLTGEACFDIVPDPSRPFYVHMPDGSRVEVLGTRFNINTYRDEPGTRTTLLDGSIRVRSSAAAAILKPGEQASVSGEGNIRLSAANLQEVMAWRNGLFVFTNADIRSIMKQLERWYDVTVVLDPNLPERRFTGEINQAIPLADVLKILEQRDLHFKLEGRTVTVIR